MSLMGTPAYMSPEQLRSADDIDTRTDLWALGVVLFELLSGQVPFGGSAPEICSQVLTGATPDVRALRPEVPAALAAVISRCLEKDRDARYASVAELAEALDPFVPEGGTLAGERVRRVQSESVAPPNFRSIGHVDMPSKKTGLSWGADGMLGPKQSYLGWLVLTGAVAVLAVVVLFFAVRAKRSNEDQGVSSAPLPAVAADLSTPPSAVVAPAPAPTPTAATEGADPQPAASTPTTQPTSPRQLRPVPRAPGGGSARPRVPKKDNILDSR